MVFMPTVVTIIAVLARLVHGHPSYQKQADEPDATWEFSLYQNSRCTREASLFSESHSTFCQDTIYNGGALAYIQRIADPNCKIHFFSDGHCAPNSTMRAVGAQAESTCLPVPKVKRGEYIRSFYVRC